MRIGLLALSLAAAPAWACDDPQVITGSAPEDGAENVPTNASLFVFFEHGGDNWINFDLTTNGQPVGASAAVRFGGELTEAASAVALVAPIDPLLPNTTYTLTASSDTLEVGGAPGSWSIQFTTGADEDTTKPLYDGIASAGFSVLPEETVDACAAATRRWHFSVTGSEAPEEHDIVAWAVYRGNFPLVTGPTPDLVYETVPEGSTSPLCLTVQAIDQAGNVSISTAEKCVTPTQTDPEDTGDTDTPTDTGPRDTFRDSWDSGWSRETGRDTWWGDWDDNWGRSGLTVRVCGPAIPSAPAVLVPLMLLLLLGRRRQA